MTRKDYAMLSAAIAREVTLASVFCNASVRLSAISAVAKSIADGIAADNKAFDAARFMRDCRLAS